MSSRAQALVTSQGWTHKPSGTDQWAVQTCPFCSNTNFKFIINVSGGEEDGLWDCKVCSRFGNWYSLKSELGLSVEGVASMKDAVAVNTKPQALPNIDLLHDALMTNDEFGDVLDHLVADRQFSIDVLKEFKIGARWNYGKKWFVIPYLDAAGNAIYYKERTSVGYDKDFGAPAGREAPLFNQPCLVDGMDSLIIVEGECDALSMLSNGFYNVVGVPGASIKKAAWIEKIDQVKPRVIYLIYDNDKAGQTGARALAARIGLDKVRNVLLPQFGGKDINDWFVQGKTSDELLELINTSKQFDVQGVQSVPGLLTELEEEIVTKGIEPTYTCPWPSLTKKFGGGEPGDLIAVMAEGKIGKTTMVLNWLHWFAAQGIDSLLLCDEMTPRRMVRKWASMVTETPDTPGQSKFTVETIKSALGIAATMQGDLLLGSSSERKMSVVAETIKQAVRRYGVKVVAYDNLQLLSRNIEHSTAEMNALSKTFKSLAMELGVLLILIVQPHRVPDGQIISPRNALGSSAIEKDVDTFICLHRNRVAPMRKEADFKGFADTDESFEPHMLATVGLCRYGSGGQTALWINGATSQVKEIGNDGIDIPKPSGCNITVETSVQV